MGPNEAMLKNVNSFYVESAMDKYYNGQLTMDDEPDHSKYFIYSTLVQDS